MVGGVGDDDVVGEVDVAKRWFYCAVNAVAYENDSSGIEFESLAKNERRRWRFFQNSPKGAVLAAE